MFAIVTNSTDDQIDRACFAKDFVPDFWVLKAKKAEDFFIAGIYINDNEELYTINPYDDKDFYKVYQIGFDDDNNEFIYIIEFKSKKVIRTSHTNRVKASRVLNAVLVYQDVEGEPDKFVVIKSRYATVGMKYSRESIEILINAIP